MPPLLTVLQARRRQKVMKMGFVPLRQRQPWKPSAPTAVKAPNANMPVAPNADVPVASISKRFAPPPPNEDFSQATKALYERELAKGVSENEEIFAAEEVVTTNTRPQWANKHRPRRPRYFNRVQMGYEWNKYNQTHYDYDNPPPKVVQGYRFNIFYPDLIDKTKAPTYKIEREHGRKRGQSFAPAGQEDTCLIRFMAGPPYQDIAFRIVDKEWDYSAKRERGFRSTFDKVRIAVSSISALIMCINATSSSQGILQLHFQFKRVCLRDLCMISHESDSANYYHYRSTIGSKLRRQGLLSFQMHNKYCYLPPTEHLLTVVQHNIWAYQKKKIFFFFFQ